MLKRIKGKGLFLFLVLVLVLSTGSFEFLNSNFGYIAMAEEQYYIPKNDINAFYGDFDASSSNVSGYIMAIDVIRDHDYKDNPIYEIDNIEIQQGYPTPKRSHGFSLSTIFHNRNFAINGDDLPKIVISNSDGDVLHEEPLVFPTMRTVPPQMPGEPPDNAPSYIPLDRSTSTVLVPYFPDADSVIIIKGNEVFYDSQSMEPVLKKKNDYIDNSHDYLITQTTASAPSSSNFLNILIISSGFPDTEQSIFVTKANEVKNLLGKTEPFSNRLSNININPVFQTNDLGCYINCNEIDRMMCCDNKAVMNAAASSGSPFDEIIVIHNIDTYSGGGYRESGQAYKVNSAITYAAVYNGQYTARMALHEFGHSFGNLCDEYLYGDDDVYPYLDCVNCRSSCNDWSDLSSSCKTGCASKPSFSRPTESIMYALSNLSFNDPSIMANYSPDGLDVRLNYFTPTPICGTPSSITVPSSSSTDNYKVSWGTSNTGNVTYILEEATNAAFTSGLRQAYKGTATSASITGRTSETTYYYRVKATRSGYNDSDWLTGSNGCSVSIPPTCGTPSSISVPSSSNTGDYTVSWGTSSTDTVTYVLQEATNATFTSGVRQAYSGTATSTSITGRTSGTTYYYRVKATRSGYIDSAWRTGSNGCSVSIPCGTPSSISVPSSSSTDNYTISWGTSSTGTVTYVLQEATNAAFTSGLRQAYSGTATSTSITGRTSGTTYYYRVKATRSGYKDSEWHTVSNGCSVSIPCDTPSSISIPSSSNTGDYKVSWGTSSTDTVTYVLQEATNAAFTSGLRQAYKGTVTNASITGRSSGTTYYYRVKATKSGYTDSAWKKGNSGCLVAGKDMPGVLLLLLGD